MLVGPINLWHSNSGVVDLVGLYSCFSFPEWRFVRFVFLPGTWLVSSSLVLTIAAGFWRWDLCFPCISYLVLVPLLGAPVLAELFAPRACSLWRLRPWWPSRLSSYAGVWGGLFLLASLGMQRSHAVVLFSAFCRLRQGCSPSKNVFPCLVKTLVDFVYHGLWLVYMSTISV
jgi:hypothetical protein